MAIIICGTYGVQYRSHLAVAYCIKHPEQRDKQVHLTMTHYHNPGQTNETKNAETSERPNSVEIETVKTKIGEDKLALILKIKIVPVLSSPVLSLSVSVHQFKLSLDKLAAYAIHMI